MKLINTFLLAVTCLFFGTGNLKAQSELILDNTYTIEEMVMDFFNNSSVTVSNITYAGDPTAFSFFDAGNSDLAVNAGILLSSGNPYLNNNQISVAGPAADFISTSYDGIGDPDLIALSGATCYDAAVIEFDFTASEDDTLYFHYVFGSEEYPEYSCSAFNDVFGFFVSGPGISGPFSGNAMNVSVLPGTSTPVAINSVHPENGAGCPPENEAFYVDNSSSQDIVYDGLINELPATITVVAGNTYHAKIAIADISDTVFDSGVFFGYNSLGNMDSLVPPTIFQFVSVDGNMVEIENESKYARSYHWDFGNGETSTERDPGPIVYDEPGTYTITLTTENYCCTNTFSQTVEIEGSNAVNDWSANNIRVFPNPASEVLNIDNGSGKSVNQVRLFNQLGEQILVLPYREKIDLPATLAKGIYFLELEMDNAERLTGKVLVD